MRSKDFIENVPIYMVDAEASADRISVSATFYTTASAATAPRDGSHVLIKAGSDKSSAVAIRLNTGDGNPHSGNVTLSNSSAIYSGAIRSGGIYEFIWSSSDTAWQIMNPQVDYANETYPGVILIATTAEAATGTNATKAITPLLLAAKFSASYATTASAGLVELATTAEISIGTNISAVITPAVLHTYCSAATTVSAGMLEIATTAEMLSGTDTTRAINAAVLAYARPYLLAVRCFSASAEIYTKNHLASAWTFSAVGAGQVGRFRVTHNIGLASVNAMVVQVQIGPNSHAGGYPYAVVPEVSASAFYVQVAEGVSGNGTSSSATVYIAGHRVT
jgi:hypothetical protein